MALLSKREIGNMADLLEDIIKHALPVVIALKTPDFYAKEWLKDETLYRHIRTFVNIPCSKFIDVVVVERNVRGEDSVHRYTLYVDDLMREDWEKAILERHMADQKGEK